MERWINKAFQVGLTIGAIGWTSSALAQDPLPPDSHIQSESVSPETMAEGTTAPTPSTGVSDSVAYPDSTALEYAGPSYIPENILVDQHYIELQSIYWRAGSPKNQGAISSLFSIQVPNDPVLVTTYRADPANTDHEIGLRSFIGRRVTQRLSGELGGFWVYKFHEPSGFVTQSQTSNFGGLVIIQPQFDPTSEAIDSIFFNSRNNYWGLEANARWQVVESPIFALEAIGGVRFLDYDETFTMQVVSLADITTNEAFRTDNSLVGPQIGADARLRIQEYVSLRAVFKYAFATNFSEIDIQGPIGGATRLTSASTIGATYDEPCCSIAEMMFAGTLHLTPNVQLTAGYNLIWLSDIYRATSQIDVNQPPARLDVSDSLWITGFVVGAKYVY